MYIRYSANITITGHKFKVDTCLWSLLATLEVEVIFYSNLSALLFIFIFLFFCIEFNVAVFITNQVRL